MKLPKMGARCRALRWGNLSTATVMEEVRVEEFSDRGSTPLSSTRIRSVELGFLRNMFALAIEIEVGR